MFVRLLLRAFEEGERRETCIRKGRRFDLACVRARLYTLSLLLLLLLAHSIIHSSPLGRGDGIWWFDFRFPTNHASRPGWSTFGREQEGSSCPSALGCSIALSFSSRLCCSRRNKRRQWKKKLISARSSAIRCFRRYAKGILDFGVKFQGKMELVVRWLVIDFANFCGPVKWQRRRRRCPLQSFVIIISANLCALTYSPLSEECVRERARECVWWKTRLVGRA